MAKLKLPKIDRDAIAQNVQDLTDLEDVQMQLEAAGIGDEDILRSIRTNLTRAKALLEITIDG
jgi:hypothetical protein